MPLTPAGPRRRRLCGAVLGTLTLAVLAVQPAGAQTATVAMRGTAFVPATVQVRQVAGEVGFPAAHGHAVWTNEDQGIEHTVTFDDPRVVSSNPIPTGQRFEAVLTLAGTFTYKCLIHPSMTGTVEVVSAPAAPGPTPAAPAADEGDEGSGGPATLVLVGAGLAAVAVLAWFLLRRRRTAEAGSAEP